MTATWMASAARIAALLGVAAWAAEHTQRVRSAATRGVWALAMAASCGLPWVLPVLRAVQAPEAVAGGEATGIGAWTIGAPLLVGAELLSAAPALDAPLRAGWGLASAAMLLFLGLSIARVCRMRRSWRRTMVDGTPVLVSRSTGPAAVGLIRPEIVMPAWVLALAPAARRLSLAHEAEHVRAGDTRLLVACYLLLAAMPWNPCLWWQFRRLRLAVELDCDARVLRRHPGVRAYANTLLETGRRSGRPLLAAVALSNPITSLDRRILAMTAPSPSRPRLRIVAASVAALAAVIAACSAPTPPAPAADGAASPPPTEAATVPTDPTAQAAPLDIAAQPSSTPRTVEPELPADQRERLMRYLDEHAPAAVSEHASTARVVLWVFIDERGATGNTAVVESSGSPAFDEVAREALRQVRWTPARLHDDPAPVWVQLPVSFQAPG